jgi:hypothetical protein
VPAVPKKQRGAAPQEPRYKKILAEGGDILMPDPGDAAYLLDYWRDAGCAVPGGMSLAALTSEELVAWQNGSHTALSPWEFQTILDMSREYVGFLRTAEDPATASPHGEHVEQEKRDTVKRNLASAFEMLMQPRNRKRRKK